MAVRTVGTGIGTYLSQDGQWRFGMLGDEVDVHDDDVERFDRLNGPAPVEQVEVEAVPVVVTEKKTTRKAPAKRAGK